MVFLDYHIHAVAHGEYEYSYEWLTEFVNQAKQKNIKEIGFSEHDEFINRIDIDVIEKIKSQNPEVDIKLGLEVDYIPSDERKIQQIISTHNFDYVIGSIHFIGGFGFDNPINRDTFDSLDVDEIYTDYYKLLEKMVATKLFDVVGHFDLIKIWGHKPVNNSLRSLIEPVLQVVKKHDLTIEINSGGLRKPVNEIYPSQEIVKLMFESNIGVTFGSDAHHPDQMGEGLNKCYELALKAGYRQGVKFKQRVKLIFPII